MNLRTCGLARNRKFSKALFRIQSRIKPFLDAFSQIEFESNYFGSITVGITDDDIPGGCESEIYRGDLECMVKCSLSGTDDENIAEEFDAYCQGISLCPFTESDRAKVDQFLNEWRARLAPTVESDSC